MTSGIGRTAELVAVAGAAKSCANEANPGVRFSNASGARKRGRFTVSAPSQKASRFCTGRGREIMSRMMPTRIGLRAMRSDMPRSELHIR
jgi:hypothetical protein